MKHAVIRKCKACNRFNVGRGFKFIAEMQKEEKEVINNAAKTTVEIFSKSMMFCICQSCREKENGV